MKYLASAILSYTLLMLAVHVSSWNLVLAWYGEAESWAKRWLRPRWVLRGEAFYWGLTLLGWGLWTSLIMRIAVACFAVLHIGAWAAGELHPTQTEPVARPESLRRRLAMAIGLFDLAEAFALVAVGWCATCFVIGR